MASDSISPALSKHHILGEILLGLDSAADLARASAAFLRVVGFLRRNRPLYRPPVLVFLDPEGYLHHAEPWHRSASSTARAFVRAADFRLSFLPDWGSWWRRDAGGGRRLLSRRTDTGAGSFADLIVCDPLRRRYVRIPRAAGAFGARDREDYRFAVLAPAGDGEDGSSLAVVWMVRLEGKVTVTALVFSSDTGEWRAARFNGWTRCNAVLTSCRHHPHTEASAGHRLGRRHSAKSSCSTRAGWNSLCCACLASREAFTGSTPLWKQGKGNWEGKLGFLTLCDGKLHLYCKSWQNNGVGSEEWLHEKTIHLPDGLGYSYTFSAVGGGCLVLQAVPLPQQSAEPADHVPQMPEIWYFTLNIRTLLVERLCALTKRINSGHLYANFLPPLSLPPSV
ncbi:hypothetical protein BS78_08G142500 [Paspalum vaginatum]|nr:hypothetical protein BS78_08G142500 [Paspalum vaginatum]